MKNIENMNTNCHKKDKHLNMTLKKQLIAFKLF